MNEEIFDVVNDFDEVIGQQPRSFCQRPAPHLAAAWELAFESWKGFKQIEDQGEEQAETAIRGFT